MHTAKTQIVCQPQRNCFLLRPNPHYGHYGAAALIDPVVLCAITISWNNIAIPVRNGPNYGDPDERPFPLLTYDFGHPAMCDFTPRTSPVMVEEQVPGVRALFDNVVNLVPFECAIQPCGAPFGVLSLPPKLATTRTRPGSYLCYSGRGR